MSDLAKLSAIEMIMVRTGLTLLRNHVWKTLTEKNRSPWGRMTVPTEFGVFTTDIQELENLSNQFQLFKQPRKEK